MERKSFAENPWVKILFPTVVLLAPVGLSIYVSDISQNSRIEIIDRDINGIKADIKEFRASLNTLTKEVPLIRLAVERDNKALDIAVGAVSNQTTRNAENINGVAKNSRDSHRDLERRILRLETMLQKRELLN